MNILLFFIILVVLIVVHELGHFIAAKRSGIRVDEFGIGFPPRALTFWKRGETRYTLNWLPIGGFVKIFGEDPDDESLRGPDKERSFVHKSRWIQALVLVAGVASNVILAWAIFAVVFMAGMPTALSGSESGEVAGQRLVISSVLTDSPAQQAGLISGDVILSVRAGESMAAELAPQAVSRFIEEHEGTVLFFEIERAGEVLAVDLLSERGVIAGEPEQPAVGIAMGLVGNLRLPPLAALFEAARFTGVMLATITVAILGFVASAFTLSADLSQVAGPVGIVSLVGDVASMGVIPLLLFTAFISLNLAVINLLPFPALDGGRLLFVLIEAMKGSPIRPSVANALNSLGFALLILLMVAITYNDILRLLG